MAPRGTRAALQSLQAACQDCHVCVDAGIIPEANPTFAGEWGAPFFLVGQAPGPAERESRRPFSGRAGKELDRWMLRAGFSTAEEFRHLTYIAALMRCFPGRNRAGTGDLRPPPAAVANCAHWLDAELDLLKPRVLMLVGQMAIARFLGPGTLESRVGRIYLPTTWGGGTRRRRGPEGRPDYRPMTSKHPVVVPLPHPSGQSRWLNDHANRARLEKALAKLSKLRAEAVV